MTQDEIRDKAMTETQAKANEAFYKWEADNNEQDLSDRDRMIWTAGWCGVQRTWIGLTDEDRLDLAKAQHGWEDLLIATEAKLKEKNNV